LSYLDGNNAVGGGVVKLATPIVPPSVRWRRSSLAGTDASDLVSAACYRCSEYVGVQAVIVSELKFRDVERHIFLAHLVERADHATLEDAPKTLNRIRVHRADHILLGLVFNGLARIFLQAIIDGVFIGREQANLIGNDLADKPLRCIFRNAIKHAGNHVALALHGADDRNLAGRLAASLTVVPLIPVAVLVLAAHPRFINLDNAAKLLLWGDQRGADFVAHGMGRLVAAKAHHALNLQGAHSLLAGEHEMGDPEPVAERLLGILEDGPDKRGETVAVRVAGFALPMKRLVARGVVKLRIAATRAMDAFRPTPRHKVIQAGRVVPNRETGLKLGRGHLRNWLRTFCHGGYPLNLSVGEYCHA
jgi:hypothetical protein